MMRANLDNPTTHEQSNMDMIGGSTRQLEGPGQPRRRSLRTIVPAASAALLLGVACVAVAGSLDRAPVVEATRVAQADGSVSRVSLDTGVNGHSTQAMDTRTEQFLRMHNSATGRVYRAGI